MTHKNDGPEIIGDVMLNDPALAAVLVKALQQRVEALEAQVEALVVGVNTPLILDRLRSLEADVHFAGEQRDSDREQMRERITALERFTGETDRDKASVAESGDIIDGYFNGRLAKLESQMHSVIRTLETLAVWKRCIERTVDPHGDMDLT